MLDVNVNVSHKAPVTDVTPILPVNAQDDSEWGIREFADFFEITPRAVRFYEDKGLLKPERRGTMRVFRPIDYLRLSKILRAKRLGFSLSDIKEVLDVTDGLISDGVELNRRKNNFETVIRSLNRRREDIDILTKDMTEICSVISHTLEHTTDVGGLSNLAMQYEAIFSQTLVDDFNLDSLESIDPPNIQTQKELDHAKL